MRSLAIEQTIREITACDGIEGDMLGKWAGNGPRKSSVEDLIAATKKNARQGDVESMVALAKWYIFEGQDGAKGYNWCKQAADQGDGMGKAYLGYCLVAGIGCESDWEDGYEALVDVANQGANAEAKDFAAYTLGCCYKRGVHGFKLDEMKSERWLDRVTSRPTHNMLELELASVEKEPEQTPLIEPGPIGGSQLLFPDGHSPITGQSLEADACSYGTATTASLSHYSSSAASTSIQQSSCKRCSRVINDSSSMSSLCLECRAVGGK
ncbi:hypothetical protein ACHAXT_007746 [Thalassiosira profunda]